MSVEAMVNNKARISNTPKERLFTIGLAPHLFEMLGGYNKKVDFDWVVHPMKGLFLTVRANPTGGKQLLRKINHDEVGLRLNKSQRNPIPYPFKSVDIRFDRIKVRRKKKEVTITLPFGLIHRTRPRGEKDIGPLVRGALPKYDITVYPAIKADGTEIVFRGVPCENKQDAIDIGFERAMKMGIILEGKPKVKRLKGE